MPDASQTTIIGVRPKGLLRDHRGPITRIAWSSDGKLLATPSVDGFVNVWDVKRSTPIKSFKAHSGAVNAVSWSPDARKIASAGEGGEIFVWDIASGSVLNSIKADTQAVYAIAWSPDGEILAAGSQDRKIRLWETGNWQTVAILTGHTQGVNGLVWYPDGRSLASVSYDTRLRLWNIDAVKAFGRPRTGRAQVIVDWQVVDWGIFDWHEGSRKDQSCVELEGHSAGVNCIAISPTRLLLATGGDDRTVAIWNAEKGFRTQILEGHTSSVRSVEFSADGIFLVSQSVDGSTRVWRTDTWEEVVRLESASSRFWLSSAIFNPKRPLLAVPQDGDTAIRLFELDSEILLGSDSKWKSVRYANAKVALIGETGVGKSALGHRLSHGEWKPTDGSTHGMNVWLLQGEPEREVLLWDFAGQSEYRLIHQLFLQHTSVALLLYDPSRSDDLPHEIDFWDKALARFQKSLHSKFLVAGRVDVGSVRITKDELTKICAERGYAGQFVTSAKSGEGCAELRSAVLSSIQWSNLPTTRSPTIFKRIKDFLTTLREGNRILVQEQQIYREFCEIEELDAPSQQEFTTVIGHVENVGLIERLSFGDIVLLKPELLNSYSSAVIDAARRNTAGLGFVRKSAVLNGEITLKETGGLNETEQVLLLHATAELFLRLGLALEQDEHLVFPSKLNRRMPPIPRGSAWDSTVTFDGPAEAVYSTLVVKLFLGKLFTLKKLWKNAAEFASPAGTSCGFQVTSRDDGSSLLRVFISNGIPASDRALLTTVTLEHFRDRQVEAKFQRFHRCSKCGEQARDRQALVRALEKGRTKIPCQYCSGVVDLREDVSRMVGSKSRYIEQANSIDIEAKAAMKRSGDLVAASAEIRSSRFLDWVGGANLANVSIVFADIVDSTSLNNSMGDAAWGEIRDEYFRRAYDLVEEHEGYLIKTIGDAVMVAFHNSLKALDFSLSIHQNPGHVSIRVNVGIHTGQVQIADNDAFGQHVNMAARVASFAKGSSIAVSARVRDDILSFDPRRRIRWKEHPCVSLKGFNDAFTLWSVERTGE